MKLLSKLTLLAVGVSVLPLGIAGYSSLHIGQGALRDALEENELTVAKQVAGYAESHVDNLLSILRVDAEDLRPDPLGGRTKGRRPRRWSSFSQLVYHQSDDFCAAAMFDEHGTLIGQPAYLENPGRYDAFSGHEPMRPTDVEGVGLMAPARDRRCRPVRGWGRSSSAARCGCRTSCWRWPSIPSWAAGGGSSRAEVSLKRLANYVAKLAERRHRRRAHRRARPPHRLGLARRRRQPGDDPAARRARGRGAPGRGRRRVRARRAARSSAPTPRSPAGRWGRWWTRRSTRRSCRSTGSRWPRCSGSRSPR